MDETLPLLPDQERDLVAECDEGTWKDIVDFDPNGDAENPTEWPAPYKWGIVVLLALMAFTVYSASPPPQARTASQAVVYAGACIY